MIKTLLRFFIFVVLVLVNMTLFMWTAAYFNPLADERNAGRSFIRSVHADNMPTTREKKTLPRVSSKTPSLTAPNTVADLTAASFSIDFAENTFLLSTPQRNALGNFIQRELQEQPAMQVRILTNKVSREGATGMPQYTKLRAQNVARVIFAYTQTIEIASTELALNNSVLIELLPPSEAMTELNRTP